MITQVQLARLIAQPCSSDSDRGSRDSHTDRRRHQRDDDGRRAGDGNGAAGSAAAPPSAPPEAKAMMAKDSRRKRQQGRRQRHSDAKAEGVVPGSAIESPSPTSEFVVEQVQATGAVAGDSVRPALQLRSPERGSKHRDRRVAR